MDKKLEKMIREEGLDETSILSEMATSPWRKQRNDAESRKDDTRSRIRNSVAPEGTVIRRPKPQPSINDSDYKRIAVYARVSTSAEAQVSSIENQTKYYTEKVAEKENWDLYKIYSDEGKSGTSMKQRTEFKKMLQDASEGKFDTILCASVSRFARNITDCIEQIKHLKNNNPKHPVGVYFETEGLYTLDPNSTMALFVHAMLADWESDNKSKRMILSLDQRICTGQYPVADLLGYRHTKDGKLIVVDDEALTVRYIFVSFLLGDSLPEIAEKLTALKRPTLLGRTDWNADMSGAIMKNERRWGDLEARKSIVLDYKEKKTVKNYDMRISAYVPNHHEGIVSREMAYAAKLLGESSCTGIPEISVIEEGGLKGFVTVTPGWEGVNALMYRDISRSAYTEDEFQKIEHESRIISGTEHTPENFGDLAGYEIPNSAFFIDGSSSTLTFTKGHLRINKRLHEKFIGTDFVEILYHPYLQAVIIRNSTKDRSGAIALRGSGGNRIETISAVPFCRMVYDQMDWIDDYGFKFRGITRNHDDQTVMLFFLDEPQILIGKGKTKGREGSNYIPYRKSEIENNCIDENRNRFGVSFAFRKMRDRIFKKLTRKDLMVTAKIRTNPLIGVLPTIEELKAERERLLSIMMEKGGFEQDGREK